MRVPTLTLALAVLILGSMPAPAQDEPVPEQPAQVQPAPVRPVRARPPVGPVEDFMGLSNMLREATQKASAMLETLKQLPGQSTQQLSTEALLAYRAELDNQLSALRDGLSQITDQIRGAMEKLPTRPVSRLIVLQHASPEEVAKLLGVFGRGTQLVPNDRMQVLAVSGPADEVAQIEEAVKSLDRPPTPEPVRENIELEVQILRGRTAPQGTLIAPATPGEPLVTPVPERLQPVVADLKARFPYSEYSLMSTLLLRCRDGEGAQVNGALPVQPGGDESTGTPIQNLSVDDVMLSDTAGMKVVRLRDFVYGANIPIPPPPATSAPRPVMRGMQRQDFGLKVQADVPEGQNVLIGKVDLGADPASLFVVVNARIVGAPAAP